MMALLRSSLAGCVVLGCVMFGGVEDDFARARRQFELHNYKSALSAVEDYLTGVEAGEGVAKAQALRARCLLKLQQWDEGIAAMEQLFNDYPEWDAHAELHVAIAEASSHRPGGSATAIKHFQKAFELYAAAGQRHAAAQMAIRCGKAFERLTDWQKLELPGVKLPSDWRETRELQRDFAVTWLDKGIELTDDAAVASAAMLAKASLFHRQLRLDETDIEKAIDIYRALVRRWPESKDTPAAELEIGRLLEQYHRDYVGALAQYEKVIQHHPQSGLARRAGRFIKNIVSPVVRIGVDGPVLPGEQADIAVEVRNVGELIFQAYRVDLFDLVRRIGHVSKLSEWPPPGAAAATWSVKIPDVGEHIFRSTRDGTLPPVAAPLSEPGAYVIVARDGAHHAKASRAVSLMVISKLALVTKSSKTGVVVWAVDALTGVPAVGAETMTQERVSGQEYRYREGKTDPQGLYRATSPGGSQRGGQAFSIYARQGEHYALCNSSSFWYWWGYPKGYRVYSFTDRPVYKPKQVIHFKHVLRRYEAGDYHNMPHKELKVTVRDPKGETVFEQTLTTNEHGTVSGDIHLPSPVALGIYSVAVQVDGRHLYGGQGSRFRVEEYRKPEFEVTVGAAEPRYAPSEPVDVRIEARYYFGSPVSEATVHYTVHRGPIRPAYRYPAPYPWYFDQLGPWWVQNNRGVIPSFCYLPYSEPESLVQRGELETDAQGVAILRLPPDTRAVSSPDESGGFRYRVDVEVTDSSRRTVTGSGSVNVTPTPFTISAQPQRRLYQPGDNVQIDIEARGANDDPVSFKGTIQVYRLVGAKPKKKDAATGATLEPGDQVARAEIETDAQGKGRFRWIAKEEGPFRFIVTAAAGKREAPVVGQCEVWIARRGGSLKYHAYRDVELVPDKYVYQIGETARVLIDSRYDDAFVLLSIEADELLDYRLVHLSGGGKVIELPIESSHTPNFYLVATLIRDNKVFQDQQAIVVPPTGQFLSVAVESDSDTFGPGDEGHFTVTTTGMDGRPADAEVALMMVDASIYYVQPEFRQAVQEYFYGRVRPQMVGTQTSFDLLTGGSRYITRGFAAGAGGMPVSPAMMDVTGAEGVMAKAVPADGNAAAAEPAFATAVIRRDFPDAVFWAGDVATGSSGRATIDIAFPDTLTRWKLIAIAVDDETRVGETSRDFVTRKDVIARLETPRFLVAGDLCQISVVAHNDLKTSKTVRVSLTTSGPVSLADATIDGRRVEYVKPHTVEVPIESGGEAAVDFEVMAIEAGAATFTATVATDVAADAMETDVQVLTFGTRKLVTQTGVIRDGDDVAAQTVSFTLPQEMDTETPILEVHLNPTIAGVILDAIPYLLEYPYGCTEQTMSRFLPAVMTRRTLDGLGVQLSDLAARARALGAGENSDGRGTHARWWDRNPVFNNSMLNDIVAVGLTRLGELQSAEGGWGWWREAWSDPYMTAYVVYGLAEAIKAKVAVDQAMVDRGVGYLRQTITHPRARSGYRFGFAEPNLRVWMLYALSEADASLLHDPDVHDAIDQVYAGRDDLTDYGRAMLALVLHRTQDRERTRTVIDNLENTVRVDEATQCASWGRRRGYYRWFDNGLETTAMVLRALLETSPGHPHIQAAANWLVRNRQGARWSSTKDTAFAVYALAEYLERSRELEADMNVTVTLDGGLKRSFRITPDNVLTFDARMIYAPYHVTPGEHHIRIEREGRGTIYYAVYEDYYTMEDPIAAAGHEINVRRSYARLIPKEVERTRWVWDFATGGNVEQKYRAIDYDREAIGPGDVIRSGDLIEVALAIEARNNFAYILIEDPKPAGCEPVSLHSGGQYGEGLYSNVEFRDKHVAFFVNYLPQGTSKLSYRLRCETPGKFGALPSRAEAMYSPYLRANGSSDRLVIRP